MIVLGNKIDLIPPDSEVGYLKNVYRVLQDEIATAGFAETFNILGTVLTSAKTGFGVEALITVGEQQADGRNRAHNKTFLQTIYLNWLTPEHRLRGDVYVVGCTNAGKS